jgi:two-component system osmolarity sensor histidine kinase EnvZ
MTQHRPFLKHLLPRTLFGRSLLIILLPVLLVQIITTFFFFERHWSVVTRRLSSAVAGDIATVAQEAEDIPRANVRDDVLTRQSQTLDMGVTFVPDATLPPWQQPSLNPELSKSLRNALNDQVQRPFQLTIYNRNESIGVDVQLKNGVLKVLVPERRLFTRATYVFLLWMIGSSIILSGVALLFMRNQIRPIRRLARAAESFGKGQDVARFKPEGASEVRQAAIAFLEMRDRIRRQMTQRTAMLAGVSHDLRTPLTRMKLQLALMERSEDIEALQQDVTDMETMVEGYLAFARGEEEETAISTDIAGLVEETAEAVRRGQGSVEVEINARPVLMVRRMALKRCLANLLENARHYAGHARIAVNSDRTRVEIVIDDDGPGIRPEHRADVFRPFFRLDQSRNSNMGGSGLGLPIARDIARSHGGDVTLDDSPLGGLRVILRLPS